MNDIDPRMAGKLEKLYDHIDAQAPPSRLLSFQPDEHGRRRGIEVAAGAVGILVVAAAGVGLAIGLSNHHGKPVGVAAPSSPTPTVQATATPSATVQQTQNPPSAAPVIPASQVTFSGPMTGTVTLSNSHIGCAVTASGPWIGIDTTFSLGGVAY